MDDGNASTSAQRSTTRRRNRATRQNTVDDGADSDGSMPSLQTVSDSSEAETTYDSVEDDVASDDDDLPPLASASGDAPPRRNVTMATVEDEEESDSEHETFETSPFRAFRQFHGGFFRPGERRAPQVCISVI